MLFDREADGTCAIEVQETDAAQGNYLDLITAAEEMTDLCMDFSDPAEGSIATNIGRVPLMFLLY